VVDGLPRRVIDKIKRDDAVFAIRLPAPRANILSMERTSRAALAFLLAFTLAAFVCGLGGML
jgi:hypothetical protein